MWDDQVAALKDAYRVIRHDTRGFGETETDAVAFSNRADDISARLGFSAGRDSVEVSGRSVSAR